MADWKPKPKHGARFEGLNLTSEEGFVLSRLDGSSSLKDVVHVTGLPEGRVKQILDKLVKTGAVEGDGGGGGGSAGVPGARPAARASSAQQKADELAAARAALLDDPSSEIQGAGGDDDDLFMDKTIDATMDDQPIVTEDQESPPSSPAKVAVAGDEVQIADAPVEEERNTDRSEPDSSAEQGEPSGEKSEEGEKEIGEVEQANYRKIYETELSKLEVVEREVLAHSAKDPQLLALCFDAHPSVIKGIFENANAGFPHARLVARHHRTPQGLDIVLARPEFFRDIQTQRLMLANTMLQDMQLKKILQPKRLQEIFKVTLNRDLPERNRNKARNLLRTKWTQVDGEERAGLIFNTEGRCLLALQGVPFDSQTISLLCQKTYTSTLLIQNLARFSATPPPLLAHLSKQAVVRRQAHLKQLIKQHPNCPSDVKRGG